MSDEHRRFNLIGLCAQCSDSKLWHTAHGCTFDSEEDSPCGCPAYITPYCDLESELKIARDELACINHGGSNEWGRNCPECAVDKDEKIYRLQQQLFQFDVLDRLKSERHWTWALSHDDDGIKCCIYGDGVSVEALGVSKQEAIFSAVAAASRLAGEEKRT